MTQPPPGPESGLPSEEGASAGLRIFLIADVRGYTRYTQEHGDEAAAELAGAFASITRAVATRCGGNVIELRGDEALVVFGSARQALRAAIELQDAFAGRAGGDAALPLGVGIGVDAGEAVPLEQGYRGGALNLAARLCSEAQPGEVLASESVTHLAGRVKGLEYREPGRLRLKGLAQPVRAYQVVTEGAARMKRPRGHAAAVRKRWRQAAIALTVVATATLVLVLALGRSGSGPSLARIDANSAGAIDPSTNRLVDQVSVGTGPGRLAAGFGSLWVVNDLDNTVSRIDPVTGNTQTITVDADPTAIAVGAGFVWVACASTRTVNRIDPRLNRVTQRPGVGNGPSGVAISPRAVWVTNRLDDTVTEIDSKTGHVRRTREAGASPSDIAYGFGALWIANESSSTVTRLDPTVGGIEEIPVGNGPEAVAVGNGAIWVANSLDGNVSRIDPSTNTTTNSITVGPGPSSVLASDGSIWVADSYGARVVRIDPATSGILKKIAVGSGPQSLASIGGRIWLSTRETSAVHRGGTLRLDDFISIDSVDSATGAAESGWAVLDAVGDGLVAFKRVAGLDGETLVPDLATSLPLPTDGGRTYTFHLQRGIHYSNGDPVRASDFRRALERDLRTDSQDYYGGFLGDDKCTESHCDLSRGVVTDDRAGTVTLHLRQPNPELEYQLTLPYAFPVPREVSMTKTARLGVPGTGPYMVRDFKKNKRLVLVRNPRFRQWSAAAQPEGYPDKIVFTYNTAKNARDEQVTAVESGRADLMRSPPSQRLDEIQTRYATQVHAFQLPQTYGVFLNTRVPPFDSLKARQAFNFALDRSKAVAGFGGTEGAAVTCQILPTGTPGYLPYCPYTAHPNAGGVWSGPDLAKARKLVSASGTRGEKVVVWTGDRPFMLATGRLVLATLRQLGYRASWKKVPGVDPGIYFSKAHDFHNRIQIGFNGWGPDYPAPSNFLSPQFSCSTAPPASQGSINTAELCDPHLDKASITH